MNNKTTTVRHSGIVEYTDGNLLKVRIKQSSACGTCQLAHNCNSHECKEKIVDVYCNDSTSDFKVNDEVFVVMKTNTAAYAILLGFVVPLLLLLASIFTLTVFEFRELTTALASITILIPYYIILWLLRGHLKKAITFSLEHRI